MRPARTFRAAPDVPESLAAFPAVAGNLRWAWNHDAIELFRRFGRDAWEASGHNPVRLFAALDPDRRAAAAADPGLAAHLSRVERGLAEYVAGETAWFGRAHGRAAGAPPPGGPPLAAYFSAEFGVTECLSIFAGGLGLLAGDHVKSASDLGVPLVAVGLLYQQSYFRQALDEAGVQQEIYDDNDFFSLPLERAAATPDGPPLRVPLPLPGGQAQAQVWRARVGRVPLLLLDTNLPDNAPEDRDVTDRLYGGDVDTRLRQEITLGIGGYRALKALGLLPDVFHMNEGHSAFLALERIRDLMGAPCPPGVAPPTFAEAREAAAAGLVFTTHTPVPAGHDYFAPDLVERYLGEYRAALGLPADAFLGLGRVDPGDAAEPFCMTVLALRLAAHRNAVSRLHGAVTRRTWGRLWPGVPEDEVPIGHVTNGVHLQTWVSRETDDLYERYLGPRWREEPADAAVWAGVGRIPPDEWWEVHCRRRERLVAAARRRLRAQLARRGASRAEFDAADAALRPDALTFVFARRFAAYKRAYLLIRDPSRLGRLLSDPARPAQVVVAGKAHPRDEEAQEIIRRIAALARQEPFQGRLVFLEDYDMALARSLVHGADVWLSTPRRPLEACGTSGMKAAANGALHVSTLDGWWDEAWPLVCAGGAWGDAAGAGCDAAGVSGGDAPPPCGWAVGRGEEYATPEEQDDFEADALYYLLEEEVVPAFYDRDPDGLPRAWIARAKRSVASLCPTFNAHRMVREYVEGAYLPARERCARRAADGLALARDLAAWKERLRREWPRLRVRLAEGAPGLAPGDSGRAEPPAVPAGEAICVRARVETGGVIGPDDVRAEVYLGRVDARGEIAGGRGEPMALLGRDPADGALLYEASVAPARDLAAGGLLGYTVRVLPHHPEVATPFLPGLIAWAAGD